MKVPFADFSLAFEYKKAQFMSIMEKISSEGHYINGQEVKDFESELANYLGVNHVMGCANGTEAIYLALRALDLPTGTKVLVPAFNFVSGAEAAVLAGLEPLFYPVNKDYFGFDPEQAKDWNLGKECKVLIVVHLFGLPCPMEKVMSWARDRGLLVIEDNAQSLGAEGKEGKKIGTFGDIGTSSFFPTKNLSCFGDGGCLFSNQEEWMEKARKVGRHGTKRKYHYEEIGVNSRLDTLQAGILRIKLNSLEVEIKRRNEIASKYLEALEGENLQLPRINEGFKAAFNSFPILFENDEQRKEASEYLKKKGVENMQYYPELLNDSPAYRLFGTLGSLAENRYLCKRVINLTTFPYLSDEQIDFCIKQLKSFLHTKK